MDRLSELTGHLFQMGLSCSRARDQIKYASNKDFPSGLLYKLKNSHDSAAIKQVTEDLKVLSVIDGYVHEVDTLGDKIKKNTKIPQKYDNLLALGADNKEFLRAGDRLYRSSIDDKSFNKRFAPYVDENATVGRILESLAAVCSLYSKSRALLTVPAQ